MWYSLSLIDKKLKFKEVYSHKFTQQVRLLLIQHVAKEQVLRWAVLSYKAVDALVSTLSWWMSTGKPYREHYKIGTIKF